MIFRNRECRYLSIYDSQPSCEANRHIAELTVQIARQRVIVKYVLDPGQPSGLSESLLDALEESLGAFKKHRELVLDQWIRRE